MTTIIRATDSAEFLSLVPQIAGFTPRQSLVLLPFHGKRTHGAMRVDLPPADVDPVQFANSMCALVAQLGGVDAVAIVVYTDGAPQPTHDGLLLPHLALEDALATTLHDEGFHIIESLCVTPAGWADYFDDEPRLRPLKAIPKAPAVIGIGDVSGDQLAGATLPHSDLVERERVGRALRDLGAVLAGDAHGADPSVILMAASTLDDLPSFFEDLLDHPDDLLPLESAALLWCLNRPTLRDAALVQWATDIDRGTEALEAQLSFSESGASVPDAVGDVFLGQGARPDADRLGCALTIVRHAASRAPRGAKPGALTAAAWLSWALGRSSHAGAYVDQVLEIDPQHSMAALLNTMLGAAMLPEWLMRRP